MSKAGSPIKGAVWYKDCWVAPGCNLYKALAEDKDEKRAAEICRDTREREKQLMERYK